QRQDEKVRSRKKTKLSVTGGGTQGAQAAEDVAGLAGSAGKSPSKKSAAAKGSPAKAAVAPSGALKNSGRERRRAGNHRTTPAGEGEAEEYPADETLEDDDEVSTTVDELDTILGDDDEALDDGDDLLDSANSDDIGEPGDVLALEGEDLESL